MIYFIQAGENKPIKIGWTDSIERRIGKLQAANYEKLKILHLFEGDRESEKIFHKFAKDYRIRGEWFNSNVLKDSKIANIVKSKKEIKIKPKVKLIKKSIKSSMDVKKEREARGWSQELLAVKCNVSKQSLNDWEKGGNIHMKNEVRLRQIFRVKPKEKL